MGLFDRMKKKFEDAGSQKKVKNIVDDPKKKKQEKKSVKKEDKGLSKEEIARAQSMEQSTSQPAKEKEIKKEGDKKKVDATPKDTKLAFKILIKPLLTEKVSSMGSEGKYAFEVHPRATKSEVRKAVRAAYDVNPVAVHMMVVKGKDIKFGLQRGRTKNRKKAIITLPEGKTIDVYQT